MSIEGLFVYSYWKALCFQSVLSGTEFGRVCYNSEIVRKDLTENILECFEKYPDETLDLPSAAEGTFCVTFEPRRYSNWGYPEVTDPNKPTAKPEKPKGMLYYSCEGTAKCGGSERCPEEGHYCAEATNFDGNVTKRWCLPKRQAECIKEDPGSCWHSNSLEITDDFWNRVEKCSDSSRDHDKVDDLKKMCICNDKDLYNYNMLLADPDDPNPTELLNHLPPPTTN